MTATATPTLADVLRARWQAAEPDLRRYDPGTSGDPLDDIMITAYLALSRGWSVYATQGDHTVDVAADWAEATEAQVRQAGRAAFTAHVVPAIVDVLVRRFADYPRWVAASPDASDELRADLALLEAAS